MKVILNDYIEHLGERGDTVTVKPGYARNYLIPKGLAYADTPGARRQFEQEQNKWEEMDLSRKTAAEKVASGIKGTELLFERRASEKDVLFGSVSVVDLARDLADKGFDIDKRRIGLAQPIKALGSYKIDVQIHRDVAVTLPVHVVRPGDKPAPEGEAEATADAETAVAEVKTIDAEPDASAEVDEE